MRKLLQPRPGVRVLDPVKRTPLPPEGVEVELSVYWLRRLADGDVTEGSGQLSALSLKPKPARPQADSGPLTADRQRSHA